MSKETDEDKKLDRELRLAGGNLAIGVKIPKARCDLQICANILEDYLRKAQSGEDEETLLAILKMAQYYFQSAQKGCLQVGQFINQLQKGKEAGVPTAEEM